MYFVVEEMLHANNKTSVEVALNESQMNHHIDPQNTWFLLQ